MYRLIFLVFLINYSVAEARDVVLIGAPLPLTGPLSLEGEKQRRGYELWADLANQSGGLRVGNRSLSVELVYRDYGTDSLEARLVVEQLVKEDRVDLLFAPYGSNAAREASSVAQRYRVPMIAPTASSVQTYSRGHEYLFGTFTPNVTLIGPFAQMIRDERPGVKTVGLIIRNDLFPKSLAREVVAETDRQGMTVVNTYHYAVEEQDHRSALRAFAESRPDWIFALGYTEDLVRVRQQMRETGVRAALVTMIAAPAYQEFLDLTGELSDNITSAAWWHPAVRYQGVDIFGGTERFVRLFQRKYNSLPDYVEASAALSGALFQLAVERAASLDGGKVRDQLAGLDVMTFWGPIRFGSNGQNEATPPIIFQIQEGRPVVLFPPVIRTGDLRVWVR